MNGFGSFLGNHLYSVMFGLLLALVAASVLLRTTRFVFAPQIAGTAVVLMFLVGTMVWGGAADLFVALVIGIPVVLSALAVKLFVN